MLAFVTSYLRINMNDKLFVATVSIAADNVIANRALWLFASLERCHGQQYWNTVAASGRSPKIAVLKIKKGSRVSPTALKLV